MNRITEPSTNTRAAMPSVDKLKLKLTKPAAEPVAAAEHAVSEPLPERADPFRYLVSLPFLPATEIVAHDPEEAGRLYNAWCGVTAHASPHTIRVVE